MHQARFRQAIAAIDAANADDPQTLTIDGAERPKELTHAAMLSEWVKKLRPDAGEALLLAARAHHIRRWTLPRDSYPTGRRGYLRWRTALQEMHADEAGRILRAAGYDDAAISRVQQLIRKHNLRRDAEVQALEDGLCLVFLETQLHGLRADYDDAKLIEILRKTWAKMTPAGQALALELELTPEALDLVRRATGGTEDTAAAEDAAGG